MSFNISEWSIKQPVPTIVLFLILTIGGLISFPLLGIDDSPNIDVPSVSISVSQPGADPSELESQVTKKVEDAVAGLGNIDHIISTVNDGSSNTTVNFLLGTNSDRATNDVRNAIAQISQSLPQDINDPVVKRVEFAGSSIMSYAVVSDRQSVEQLSDLIDQNISRVLLSVKGVAQVQRIGGRDRDIRVDLNPEQLQSLGITATQVNDQIRNFNINLPGGRTEIGNSEQTVRTLGSAKTIDELKTYQITLPKGGFVPLTSLGEVTEGYAEARQAARLNGKPVVAFSILRSTGSTLVTVEEAVRESVKKLEKSLPTDVKLELIYTLADHIRDTYEASVDALVLGAGLAVITILIFLWDWRATLIAAVALPLMAAYLFKDQGHHQKELKKDQLSYQYRRLLTWALKHRAIVLILGVALFFGSVQLIPLIPTGFIDRDDTGLSTVSIELPPGSTLQQTDLAVQQATKILLLHPAVDSVLETEGSPTVSGGAGGGGARASGVNTGTLYVKLKPADKRIGQQRFEEEMRPKLTDVPGVRLSFAQGRVGGRKQMSIVLKSENAAALTKTALALTQQMSQVPGLIEVQSSASLVKPEILVKPDPNRAADQGVSVQQIARTATLATIGDIDSNLAKFDLPDRQIPIHVMLAPQFRSDLETIKNLQVPGKNNTLVPLRAVADIALSSGPSQIDRYDRARQVSVEGNLLRGTTLGDAYTAVKQLPAMNPLPPGVEQESSGDTKVMQDIFSSFAGALGTAVLFIYAVLVLLFANFLHPVTIMAALPLSVGGALLGLLVGQKSLGLYALIGIVLLMGIVTKNSILLVDYAILNQKEGKPMYEATLDSGVARVRPILMTTIAMIAGMVPIALGLGAGSQVRSPMAMAVIGGLMTSTLLTLVVIPVIFTYMDGFQIWIFNLVRGKKRREGRSNISE
jgi:multidrug efflux pump subunit AcrB